MVFRLSLFVARLPRTFPVVIWHPSPPHVAFGNLDAALLYPRIAKRLLAPKGLVASLFTELPRRVVLGNTGRFESSIAPRLRFPSYAGTVRTPGPALRLPDNRYRGDGGVVAYRFLIVPSTKSLGSMWKLRNS